MRRDDISARCGAIEECYEFLLAYAGQGLSGKENSQRQSQVREFLNRAVAALTGLVDSYAGGRESKKIFSPRNATSHTWQFWNETRATLSPRFSWFSRNHHQLSVDRQSERFDPSPRAAHRFVPHR